MPQSLAMSWESISSRGSKSADGQARPTGEYYDMDNPHRAIHAAKSWAAAVESNLNRLRSCQEMMD